MYIFVSDFNLGLICGMIGMFLIIVLGGYLLMPKNSTNTHMEDDGVQNV